MNKRVINYGDTQEIKEEYHEHPLFNGQYHWAVWVQTWVSSGANDVIPYDAPISCVICGRYYGK